MNSHAEIPPFFGTTVGGHFFRRLTRVGRPHHLLEMQVAILPRAGWPWRLPARAPTDPDVRTLAHPVPRTNSFTIHVVPEAIQSSDVDMLIEPRCVRHVSLD